MLLSIVNLGYDRETTEACTLYYLTPVQYDNFSDTEETKQESEISKIFVESSETKLEILPAIPSDSKIIFPGNSTYVRCKDISRKSRENE